MYTVCLYCSRDLGRNELVERFPIGRRLAFDPARGRLWVVCPSCLRWCLTPLDERWEAIEACEKLSSAARVRASTSEISLVRLPEGLELVRIGAPPRPEMAAWRYGREFSARRRKTLVASGIAGGVTAAAAAGALVSGSLTGVLGLVLLFPPVLHLAGLAGVAVRAAADSARVIKVAHEGKTLRLYAADMRETHLCTAADELGWGLRMKHSYGRLTLSGDEALRVTARLLARANGSGASRGLIAESTARLMDAVSPDALVRASAVYSAALAEEHTALVRRNVALMDNGLFGGTQKMDETRNPGSLVLLAPPTRLALEMALHEHSEAMAIEGDLAPLIAAWREAEEIAGIADTLLVPTAIDAKLDALRSPKADPPRQRG